MVVFTCNHCGESLQKPRVEKHYNTVCRRPKSLTCVDCFKDFRDEEYGVHIKCVTEEERYAAKGTFANCIVKKGEVKQESWTELIKSIVERETNLAPSLRNLFNTISGFNNVPRKKPKFMNFLKSSSGGRVNYHDIEAAWELIEKYKVQSNGAKHKSPETPQNEPPVKKAKQEELPEVEAEKFSFKETIVRILSLKGSLPLKKLEKKVLSAYQKEMDVSELSDKTVKKYNKKLRKVPNVTISDDIASLVEL